MKNQYQRLAEQYRQPIQELASQLIQIPSYSLQEKNIADFLYDKMTELGYDEVIRDEYGNIFGVLRGASDGPSLTLNCHMDTVHEGSMSGWPYPPYDAAMVDGRLWGRGASDTKGTMAIQLYAPVILRKAGILPAGNVVVACVVAEESPGYGTNMQCADRRLITDYAIMGEATENDIAIASRGRCCICVHIQGKACHAAAVAGNTVFDYLELLMPVLKRIDLAADSTLGHSSLHITKIESSEPGTNVIPAAITVYCDCRLVGEDTYERIEEKVRTAIETIAMDGIAAETSIYRVPVLTYTGKEDMCIEGVMPFSVSMNEPYIMRAKNAVECAVGHPVQTKIWPFATDAGHYAAVGVKVLGYSPAETSYCHTNHDSISLTAMEESTAGYLALICELANPPAK